MASTVRLMGWYRTVTSYPHTHTHKSSAVDVWDGGGGICLGTMAFLDSIAHGNDDGVGISGHVALSLSKAPNLHRR